MHLIGGRQFLDARAQNIVRATESINGNDDSTGEGLGDRIFPTVERYADNFCDKKRPATFDGTAMSVSACIFPFF